MGEFELIRRHFTRRVVRADLGVGDDCALITPRAGYQLAVSTDLLVEGQHFFPTVDPFTLGYKSLAVNLSDLAACGAQPLAFTLAISLSKADDVWLEAFAKGLFALADAYHCELIGGDTTRGPLTIAITVFGEIPLAGQASQALLRSGAQAGDDIYVSGHLGDARLALLALQERVDLPPAALQHARQRLECPTPRVELGLHLRGLASAAIDLSDGLMGDLGHVLSQSGLGATLIADAVLDTVSTRHTYPALNLTSQQWLELALTGGDDYELLFTASADKRQLVAQASLASRTLVQRIGSIKPGQGIQVLDASGSALKTAYASFDHFASL